MLTTEHEEDIYAVSPPHWAFKVLAVLGRVLGYRLPDYPDAVDDVSGFQ